MQRQARNIFRKDRVTPEQYARDRIIREQVMREYPPLKRMVVWYDKSSKAMVGAQVLREILWKDLRRLLRIPDGRPMRGAYPLDMEQTRQLDQHLDQPIDLTRYDYYVEARIAELAPLPGSESEASETSWARDEASTTNAKDLTSTRLLTEQLRGAIRQSGRSIEQIAQSVDVSPRFIEQFLSGQNNIPMVVADRLAAALGLHLTTESTT